MSKKRILHGPSLGKKVVITIFLFFICTGICLWLIDRGITPVLVEYAETKAQQLSRDAINEAVSRQIAEDMKVEDLVRMEKDEDGNIVYMGWNSVLVNRALRNTTIRVQDYLRRMELDEVPMEDTSLDSELETDMTNDEAGQQPATLIELPIGLATGNSLLANLGPKVPVQLNIIGDVQSSIKSKYTELGINSYMLELSIHFIVSVKVVIPFSTKTTVVENDVPLDTAFIQGDIPNFYGGMGQDPQFSYPMDPLQ